MTHPTAIHPTAVVDAKAELHDEVEIGPFCVIGPGVRLGKGCRLVAHCHLQGPSSFGEDNLFYPGSAVGLDTPDKKYKGEQTRLEVGSGNCFREHTTVHRGTVQGSGVTVIGDGNLFMPCAHVAHDSRVGNDNVMTNYSGIAGHSQLGNNVVIASRVAVYQGARIGDYAFVAMHSSVTKDVPPFFYVHGDPARYIGVNRVGMSRTGRSNTEIGQVKRAAKLIARSRYKKAEVVRQLRAMAEECGDILLMADFVEQSTLGLVREK